MSVCLCVWLCVWTVFASCTKCERGFFLRALLKRSSKGESMHVETCGAPPRSAALVIVKVSNCQGLAQTLEFGRKTWSLSKREKHLFSLAKSVF